MEKTWIIVTNPANGADYIINLAFVSKITLDSTNFRVVFYQGVGTTGSTGSTQALTFANVDDAKAFYVKVTSVMKDRLGLLTDLRPSS